MGKTTFNLHLRTYSKWEEKRISWKIESCERNVTIRILLCNFLNSTSDTYDSISTIKFNSWGKSISCDSSFCCISLIRHGNQQKSNKGDWKRFTFLVMTVQQEIGLIWTKRETARKGSIFKFSFFFYTASNRETGLRQVVYNQSDQQFWKNWGNISGSQECRKKCLKATHGLAMTQTFNAVTDLLS